MGQGCHTLRSISDPVYPHRHNEHDTLPQCKLYINIHLRTNTIINSATVKSIACPSCLVGVLHDISWEKVH